MDKKGLHKSVTVNFIIPTSCKNEEEVDDSMKMAFQECEEADLSPKWLSAADCCNVTGKKNTVFVLQEFSGDIFTQLRSLKSVVCGPMCLRSCLAEGLQIPENKSPVFTTAMRGVIVTASQITPADKVDIKEKVGFMGGVYMSNLVMSVTHLITNAVLSAKYEKATEKGIPAMSVEWVDAVWVQSQKTNVKATDPQIVAKYKCPIFLNMSITCSNLSRKEKQEMKELITKNGGKFTAQLLQKETTLLVVNDGRGDKYTHARSWDLPCVRPSYVVESVRRGYAVPSRGHLVEPTVSSSTPTKEGENPDFTYNSDSSISIINHNLSKTKIEESQMSNSTMAFGSQRPPARSSGSQYADILNNLSVSDAKSAGSFMDGCKIFLSGFTSVEAEKLRRILSRGGATVFSELSDSVSHVVVGEFVVQDMRILTSLAQKPHVVTVKWLAASIKQRSPAYEEPYQCLESRRVVPEPPSPLSQKGIQLLQPPQAELDETSKMPPPSEPPVSRKLFSEFIKENAKSPAKPPSSADASSFNSTVSTQNSPTPDIFAGLNFLITGFLGNVTSNIEMEVEAVGGCVVSAQFTGIADYAVVPVLTAVPNVTAIEVVSNLWLEDCLKEKRVVEVQYYHQPLSLAADKKPLADCCISLSNYLCKEKEFLTEVAEMLGATYQDVFARVAKEDKGVLQSTHLVCPKPDGQKYKAAVRWGLPAVTKDWLLASARLGVKADETQYLVNQFSDSITAGDEICKTVKTPSSISHENPYVTAASAALNPVETQSASDSKPPNTPFSKLTSKAVETSSPMLTPPNDPPIFPHPAVTSLKRKSSAQTPEEHSPFHVSTPDTPYGQVFGTPTADTKKRWKRFIDDFPTQSRSSPPPQKVTKRQSTPLSELRRKCWAAAVEISDGNVSPNYSIQEMEEDHENEGESQDPQIPLRDEGQTPKSTLLRISKPALSCTPSSSKDCENVQPRRVSTGRSTPSISDFKSSSTTPVNQHKISDQQSSKSRSNMFNGSMTKTTDTPQRAKKSPANERVCAMLGQLHQRLSTPGTVIEEPQPLPQRELVSPAEQPPSTHKPVASTLLPESQPVLIGWEDPVESAERAKVLSSPTTTSDSVKAEKSRKFVLSNVKEREKYERLLSMLGEVVGSATAYDSDTTHLIVDSPLRSEKLLCCLAAGKWILHTSYIDHMVTFNKYLPDEEKYEWGNPQSAGTLPALVAFTSMEQQLASAAVRWRKDLSGGTAGAFTGMKAVLIASPGKYESYKRLIMAGGGEIVPATSIVEATHCFVEPNKVSTMPVPLLQFVAHRVPCLAPVFLGEMLTKFPPPSVQSGLIPEYRRLLEQEGNIH